MFLWSGNSLETITMTSVDCIIIKINIKLKKGHLQHPYGQKSWTYTPKQNYPFSNNLNITIFIMHNILATGIITIVSLTWPTYVGTEQTETSTAASASHASRWAVAVHHLQKFIKGSLFLGHYWDQLVVFISLFLICSINLTCHIKPHHDLVVVGCGSL